MRNIADNTVRRLSLYLLFLEEFQLQGAPTVSSGALAAKGGTTSAQVRKDLSFFGSFGNLLGSRMSFTRKRIQTPILLINQPGASTPE